ncbi:MAG: type II toxin-antitoxin system HicB family antitoxin [Desulfarculus sp.]|nr:type II toxin-antitoxin system HicB family antitoxin [Desulfarculus sp.]
MNILQYKGYVGEFQFDAEDRIFHGRIMNTRDIITFEGHSVEELEQAIKDSVDDYLDFCRKLGREPEKPFSGRFNVRIKPALHREVVLAARAEGKSLNAWVAEKLAQAARESLPA